MKSTIFRPHEIRNALTNGCGQFRRVLMPQPEFINNQGIPQALSIDQNGDEWLLNIKSPFGESGDRVWVREPCRIAPPESRLGAPKEGSSVVYSYDHSPMPQKYPGHPCNRSAIAMPRWASRLTLEFTGFRVERVKEVSFRDAMDEGVGTIAKQEGGRLQFHNRGKHPDTPIGKDVIKATLRGAPYWLFIYEKTWNTYAKPGYKFENNPFVCVYDYKVISNCV